jgi:outer membrane lipoprotein-sorting protein
MKKIIMALLILPGFLFAQTAEEIISQAEDAIKGKSAHGEMKMTVTTPDYTRELTMEAWYVGNKKALIIIKTPPKEAGNKTLKIGNEMWNYLKNTETTIKIPPSMMLQSWNGSDFTNDDLVRESNLTDDYFQKIIGEEEIDGELCWKILLEPKPDAPVVWGKLFYWVRKKDNLPARVEYYDEKDKLMRYMSFSEVEKMGGRTIPTKWTMQNVAKEGHSTTLKLLSMKFDINIPDRIFSFRELERGN